MVWNILYYLMIGFFWLLGGAVSLLFAGITAAAIFVKLRRRRAIKTLAKKACLQCGRPFGLDAAVNARNTCKAECDERRRLNPGVKLRLAEICPAGAHTVALRPSSGQVQCACLTAEH
jgi:hypothetical protein